MSEQPEFFGKNLTTAECERLVLTRVPPENRALEARLYEKKWFDYRGMHPVVATYLFAHLYVEAARRMFAKTRDVDEAEFVRPLDNEDIFKSIYLTSLWRGRQAFDACGIKYEFGLDFALNRANDRGWSYFPRPNQLYGQELMTDMQDAWRKRCSEIFQWTADPRLKEFTCPDREAHRQWMIQQLRMRVQPAPLLATLMREGWLPEEYATAQLGVEQVERAKRF